MKNMLNMGCLVLLFALSACPSKENEKVEPKLYDAILYQKFCMPKNCFIRIENDTTIYYPYLLADSFIPQRDSLYKITLAYKVSNEPFITNGLCSIKFTQIEVLSISKNNIMKIIILILVSVLSSYSSNYYWSNGKKIYLKKDSLSLISRKQKAVDSKTSFSNIKKIKYQSDKTILLLDEFDSGKVKEIKSKYYKSFNKHLSYLYLIDDFDTLYCLNRLSVKIKNDSSYQIINDYLSKRHQNFNIDSSKRTIEFDLIEDDSLFSIANYLFENNLAIYAHPDFVGKIEFMGTDPLYSTQFYLNNTSQTGGTDNIDINAPEAWQITTGSSDIIVAVIDEGVEEHEDFSGRVLSGYSAGSSTGNGLPTSNGAGHGVACAGIIAASHNNDKGIKGICPNCKILPVNIFTTNSTSEIAASIKWAWETGNADVLSNSWGYSGSCSIYHDDIAFAISEARSKGRNNKGSVVVFSTGNSNQSLQCVKFPSKVSGVLSVGAIDKNGNIWNYSDRGPELDLVAPSGNTNLLGDIQTTDRMGSNGYETGNYTPRFGGTSASCPQVAGVAALVFSVKNCLFGYEVEQILKNTARKISGFTYNSGFSNDVGYGLVDAGAAVLRAKDTYIQNTHFFYPNKVVQTIGSIYAGSSVTNEKSTGEVYFTSSSNTTFIAKEQIRLKPGFRAGYGANFRAYTSNNIGCDPVNISYLLRKETQNSETAYTDVLSTKEINIFPNPNIGDFNLYFPFDHNYKVEIIDILGNIVFADNFSKIGTTNIVLKNLTYGIYYARITYLDQSKVLKLVIEK